ncbi:MAG: MFS transporter, partial [Chloroflexota bacterium]
MTSNPSATSAASEYVQLNRWHMFLAYATGTFGFGFSTLVSFMVPLRALELGAEPHVIGLIIGAGGLIPIFLSIPAGEWADRFGARRVFIVGTALSALATLGYALTDNYWLMLVIELLVGFPRTMPWVASQAYISNVGTPEQRTTIVGRFSSATHLVQLFGPLLAGVIATVVGYKSAFWFVFLVAVTYTVMGILLPEVHNTRSGGRAKTSGAGGFVAAASLVRLPIEQTALVMTFTRIWILVSWQ